MINITSAFATIWSSLLSAVTWTLDHGVTLSIADASLTVSFFTIAIAFAVIRLVIGILPILGDDVDE